MDDNTSVVSINIMDDIKNVSMNIIPMQKIIILFEI